MEIVTGSTGAVHVTPIDDAVRNTNYALDSEKVVFTYFENLSARAITNNQVRVFSGYGMNQGRIFKIDRNEYDNCVIENGSQGYKRADLIVARYTMNTQTGFEDIQLEVIKGQSGSSYVDPAYNTGNINEGDTIDDFPLYRVKIDGLNIVEVQRLFTLYPVGGKIGQILARLDGQMLTNLASESKGKLNGAANVEIGVKGILPIAHGGTGSNTNTGAAKNIVINSAGADTGTMTDSTEFITSPSDAGFSSSIKKRTASNIWAYFRTKIRSLLGMGDTDVVPIAHGGTGATSAAAARDALGLGNTSGAVPIANGGTGATTAAQALVNLGVPSNVADSMAKTVYTNTQTDVILVSKGGTGSSDGTLNGVKLGTSGNTRGYYDANGNFKSFRSPTGNAAAGDVRSGKTFANASSDSLTGTFAGQEKSVTAGTSATSVTPDSGKWLSKVNVNPTPSETKTVTASRSAQTVSPSSGKLLSKVTVNKYPDASGTYTATSRGSALDMGATNNLRYVNTNGVPNSNSGTYTFPANDSGATKDLGATNSYRYVNAANVYNAGKAYARTSAALNGEYGWYGYGAGAGDHIFTCGNPGLGAYSIVVVSCMGYPNNGQPGISIAEMTGYTKVTDKGIAQNAYDLGMGYLFQNVFMFKQTASSATLKFKFAHGNGGGGSSQIQCFFLQPS